MQTRGLVTMALTIVLLTGCTGAPGTSAPATSGGSSGSATPELLDGDRLRPEQVEALRARFAALAPGEQEQEIATLDADVERQLWTLSGLEAELGGAAPTDAVFTKANAAIRKKLAVAGGVLTSPVKLGRKGVVLPSDSLSEATGAALFGALMIASLANQAAASVVDGKERPTVTQDGVTSGVTKTTGTVNIHKSSVVDGVEMTIDTASTVQPCPDASGRVVASSTATAIASKGGTGSRYSYHVDVAIQVGDDAEVVSTTNDYRSEQSEFSPKGRRFVDIAIPAVGDATVKRGIGDLSDDFVRKTATSGVVMGALLAQMAERGAMEKWQSGDCVTLEPTVSAGPGGLQPGTTVTIVAAPRARDGAATGGTVVARLTDGEASVAPADTKVPADATFTYAAPGKPEKSGTVALEARSRRGIGRASIRFDTASLSFLADGSAGDFHGTGKICDLRRPFAVSGSGLKLSFTPADETRGSYRLSGNAAGGSWSGGGTYTVRLNSAKNTGKLLTTGVNTVTAAGKSYSADASVEFSLSTTAPCGK